MFNDMVTEAKGLIGAEHTGLYTVVDNKEETMPPSYGEREKVGAGNYLYGRYIGDSNEPEHAHVPLDRGILSRAVITKTSINANE